MEEICCGCKVKHRDPEEKRRLLNRLSRIEGQIRGLRGLVERDVYCADILTQSAAADAALHAFNRDLLTEHLRTCVAEDLRAGDDASLDELSKLLQKLMR